MNKKTLSLLSTFIAIVLALGTFYSVHASTAPEGNQTFYVSPLGNDANNCSKNSPCLSINAVPALPGDTITLLAGLYSGNNMDISFKGTQAAPITITGSGAILDGVSVQLTNSEWLIFENITFINTANSFDVKTSHYVAWRNNVFDYTSRGIYIRDYSSHLLIENNEFYQSCSFGKTWEQIKESNCEGGAVYGSSYGGGTYHIRDNYIHDAFNGFLFTDDSSGKWMNANIFIYDNRFERIIDDPIEPEGDSFNFHAFDNTMIDTHRMVSITESGLGPIFVYNNVQITTGNPTGEASRLNSAFKIDQANGFINGVWIFNNTIVGAEAANFYAFDMLSRSVGVPFSVRNNIYVTALTAFSKTPSGGSYDYDMSLSPFGLTEPNGIVANPMLNADGSLSNMSPAHARTTEVDIPTFFASSPVIPAGADLGGFQSMAAPAWVLPPNYPDQIPTNIDGWLDSIASTENSTNPTSTQSAASTATATATDTPIPATPTATAIQEPVSPTPIVISPTVTKTPVPTTSYTSNSFEGFGTNTVGGMGGKVYKVSDSDTFRACVNANGPRICEFASGGLIEGNFTINNPYITIKGQTAPSPVTIKGEIHIATNEVIIQYLSVRPGPGGSNHALSIYKNNVPLHNIVIDHCSLSWGTDSNIETWYQVYDVTVQWSIISEALNCSTHPKGCHSKGAMWGGPRAGESSNLPGAYNISFNHNVLAHNIERTPLVKTAGLTDVVGNVIYNPKWGFTHVDMESQVEKVLVNYVDNTFIEGPDTQSSSFGIAAANINSLGAEIYQSGNVLHRQNGSIVSGTNLVHSNALAFLVETRHNAPNITSYTAEEVLANAGNNWNGWRDAIDQRIISDVKNRAGHIIDDPSEVGGWLSTVPEPTPDNVKEPPTVTSTAIPTVVTPAATEAINPTITLTPTITTLPRFTPPPDSTAEPSANASIYVSPDGSGSLCNATTPCDIQTGLEQAESGNTIFATDGVYPSIVIDKSITLEGNGAVFESSNKYTNVINITADNVTVKGVTVRGGHDGIQASGKNVVIDGVAAHNLEGFGIEVQNENATVRNSTIYDTSRENASLNMGSGWGSGLKAYFGTDGFLFENNTIHDIYGECIAVTRAVNGTVRGNTVYDCYSVGIYIDNSNYIDVENNHIYCDNPAFYISGNPARGIALAEERYTNPYPWGNQLHDVGVRDNLIERCGGISYWGGPISGAGMKNVLMQGNRINAGHSPLSIMYESGTENVVITENVLVGIRPVWIENMSGIEYYNNSLVWEEASPTKISAPPSETPMPTSTIILPTATEPPPSETPSPTETTLPSIETVTSGPASPTPTVTETPLPATPTATIVLPTDTATLLPPASPTPSNTVPPPTATVTESPEPPPPAPAEDVPDVSDSETIFDDKDSAFTYSAGWKDSNHKKAYDGSFKKASKVGASVSLDFVGQSFSVLYKTGSAFRVMEVYVDGQLVGEIDQQSKKNRFQQRWDYPGPLSNGNHTLKLVFVADPDIKRSRVSLDAVIVR